MLWSAIGDGAYIAVQAESSLDQLHRNKRKADSIDATGTSCKKATSSDQPSRPESSRTDDITFLGTTIPDPVKPIAKCRVSQSRIDKQGMGLQATTVIEPGDTIISERPFLVVDYPPPESTIYQAYRDLSEIERLLFHSFNGKANTRESKQKVTDIIANNVVPLGGSEDGEPTRSGMFQYICRINHSCVPNARWTWVSDTSSMELKAILPIRANEEITACYLDDHAELYAERQAFLLANWGFNCSCTQCFTSKSKREASDKRLARYRVIRERYIGHDNAENWEILGFKECWTKMKEGIRLLESEERYNEVADCWESLFHLSVGWGEHAKALEAGKGWIAELARTGEFLEGAELECVKDPEMLEDWCRFIRVAEIEFAPEPESDGEDDFESHWTLSKRRRTSRKYAIRKPRVRSHSSVSSSESSSSSAASSSSVSSSC